MVSLFTSDSLGGSCLTRGLFDLRAVGTGSRCSANRTFRFFACPSVASTGESEPRKEASVGSGAEAGSALLGCIAWRRCPPGGAPDRVDRVGHGPHWSRSGFAYTRHHNRYYPYPYPRISVDMGIAHTLRYLRLSQKSRGATPLSPIPRRLGVTLFCWVRGGVPFHRSYHLVCVIPPRLSAIAA